MGKYLKRTVRCGKIVEVDKYYAPRFGTKGAPRGKQKAETPEDVAATNMRNAIRKLRWLLNTNFDASGFHMVLTYRKGDRPDPEEARRRMDRFLRELRSKAKRAGSELKYIHVTEYAAKSIHHHFIVSGVGVKEAQASWKYGRIHATPLDESGNYAALAEYLVKETKRTYADAAAPYGKRWCASKNLKQPEVIVEEVHAESWRKNPKPIKGYEIVPDSVMVGVHDATGAPWQRYWMQEIPERKDENGKRKKRSCV